MPLGTDRKYNSGLYASRIRPCNQTLNCRSGRNDKIAFSFSSLLLNFFDDEVTKRMSVISALIDDMPRLIVLALGKTEVKFVAVVDIAVFVKCLVAYP